MKAENKISKGEVNNKARKIKVEEYMTYIFKLEEYKGEIKLVYREEDWNIISKMALKVMKGLRKKKKGLLGDNRKLMSDYSYALVEVLNEKKELEEVDYYFNNKEELGKLEGYISLAIRKHFNTDAEKVEGTIKLRGVLEDGTLGDYKERIAVFLGGSIDFTYSNGEKYLDVIGAEIRDVAGDYGVLGNADFQVFVSNKEEILAPLQLEKYEILKGDFTSNNEEFKKMGYENQEEYVNSKGMTEGAYRRFIRNARKKVEDLSEYYLKDSLEGILMGYESILNDEKLSEDKCFTKLGLYISENYTREDFEVVMTEGLLLGEKKELVRGVRELSCIRGKEDVSAEEYKVFSKGLMYKLTDNIINKLVEIEKNKVKTKSKDKCLGKLKKVGESNKYRIRDEETKVYVDSYGNCIGSLDIVFK